MSAPTANLIWFDDLARGDVALVGGKNASLGEMVRTLGAKGIAVPPGFATTASAFRRFIAENALDALLDDRLTRLADGRITLHEAGTAIRAAITGGALPDDIRRSLSGPRPRPKTCPMPVSPDSRKPF